MSYNVEEFACLIRQDAIKMVHSAKASHIGSCLSIADIVAVLYEQVMRFDANNPKWQERDRLILSKGHAAAIVYAALAHKGFFPREWLGEYCGDGKPLSGHITHKHVPGVETSTGSLAHGMPIGAGICLALKADNITSKVYVIISDGECDEGTTWEAALFAGHHKLNNLIVLLDYNKIQSYGSIENVLNLHPLKDKWLSFNWQVDEIDGHDHQQLIDSLHTAQQATKPTVIICHTVKGKGVSFMENNLAWHYKYPDDAQMQQALAEVSGEK